MSSSSSSQGSGWSNDRIATLTKLWLDGLSASQIATRVGVTRNAVIGKVHRLGLSGRSAPSAPRAIAATSTGPRRPRRVASPQPVKAVRQDTPDAPLTPEAPGLVDSLVHLGPHACKWPIGDPKISGFSFCGRRAEGRYCPEHARRGVRLGPAWRADRDPTVKRALAGLI
ncbi:MAG: GcrA cell cycle regulator [Alphaproteobacteria bacterium]|nr:GcrA cell cycle regulator [Alphaproteobacteria bacterium]MBU1516531.1 GcrA cell cycle regulator [Alphaproteobacteria bacterium]MBU2094288.1 GcrA cell cycle regulator [Alphaproteobacteria bacterium]MBU2154135.1 GcrA cell cycle regulator [Alphaproteobacteria bacterium]MBU2307458.1 GcrA cell cycle regulator [Alphaproteobacteria bacterium]